ncbi:S8 family serine peptidase [Terrisporobacter petrolearius]|uniref:S8 family peptidase n=1 Tax=Terrisporobacter petrolearius TaxID=1460447 RepID=UPI001D161675|nr:S8 family serine peptidase [Terrisporobacter petrolearius]MCC3863411.1 S8 family serine peptidase [Terrisporobacter petrolearius]
MNKLRKIVITFSILTFIFIFLKNTTTIADADSPQAEKVDNYDDLSSELSNLIEENQVKQPSNSKYSSKRLIVKSKIDNLNLGDLGAKDIISGPDNLYFLQFDSEESTKDAFEKLNSNVNVKYVEPDIELEVESTQNSNNTNESTLSNTSFNSWGVKRLQIDKYVNSLPNKSKEITVGVVDSGIVSHPFLKNRVLSNGWDFLDNDNTPNDLNGHGTAMAGVLVDCTPNLNVKILPVKTFNSDGKGSTSNIALGIRYAVDNGADVLNLSFGGVHHSFLHDAVEYALKNNVVVVTSAGNDSENVSYSCPADMDSVIVTSASDQSDKIAYFSNYGNTVDVAAPGYEILTCSYKGGYTEENGTSLSAPHISAIAALIKLANPNTTPAKVESLIISSADDFGEKGWDKYYGHGIPNMSKIINKQKIIVPKAVSSFKIENYTTSQVTLSCKPVRGSYGYAIYRYNFKEKEYDKIATVKENPKSSFVRFTDKNKASGTIYNYKIRAIKKVNNKYYYGPYSKARVVTKLYKPTVTLKSSKSNVNMSWKKVNRATKYKIYRATSKNGKYHYIGYSNKTTYTDKKLTKKKTYYYKVKAVRTNNKKDYYSDYSTIKSIRVQ